MSSKGKELDIGWVFTYLALGLQIPQPILETILHCLWDYDRGAMYMVYLRRLLQPSFDKIANGQPLTVKFIFRHYANLLSIDCWLVWIYLPLDKQVAKIQYCCKVGGSIRTDPVISQNRQAQWIADLIKTIERTELLNVVAHLLLKHDWRLVNRGQLRWAKDHRRIELRPHAVPSFTVWLEFNFQFYEFQEPDLYWIAAGSFNRQSSANFLNRQGWLDSLEGVIK